MSPEAFRTRPTSSRLSTTGRRLGVRARGTCWIAPISSFKTLRYRNSNAQSTQPGKTDVGSVQFLPRATRATEQELPGPAEAERQVRSGRDRRTSQGGCP